MDPIEGMRVKCRGFEFRIDYVADGEVYFVRWKGNDEYGVAMRVSIEEWIRDTKGQPIDPLILDAIAAGPRPEIHGRTDDEYYDDYADEHVFEPEFEESEGFECGRLWSPN